MQQALSDIGPLAGKLVIVRHGETVANRDGYIMGRSDSPLTQEGIAGVKTLALFFKQYDVTTIMSSPLKRALSSARIFSEFLGAPIKVCSAIGELSAGQWEGKPRIEVLGGRSEIRTTWPDRPPGGESYEDAEPRMVSLAEEIRAQVANSTILVVGHGAVNRVFLKVWLDLDRGLAARCQFPHHVFYELGNRGAVSHGDSTGITSEGLLLTRE